MKLGRYEVVRELGKGAMGIVYLAKDPLIGRLVALKTIRPAAGTDDDEAREFQERFVREAQAAGILSHPSIVTVHDIGQDADSGVSFIAMEYVEGANLKEIITQGKALHAFEVGEIIAQVAEALDYAHARGIIHRDVKPANIMLCGDSRAKITDFGIAKIASSGNLTTTGQFLGTPNYMAPEQIKGSRIDGRTDLFSLGIVFYECLARRKPFGGDSLTSISYKIVHEPFTPLREIDPSIPEGFDHIVAKCLAKDPSARYQSGKELAEDVRRVIRGENLSKAPDRTSFDETVLNAERIPTVEIPFPDAPAASTHVRGGQGTRVNGAPAATPAVTPAAAKPPVVPPAVKEKLRRPVRNGIFFGVILAVLIPVAAAIALIPRQRVTVPPVDTKREALVNRQRELRQEAEQLLRAGNVEAAYDKYQELRKLAPNSPIVASTLRRLDEIRTAQLTRQQRVTQATTTFEQGRVLYERKDYAGAIPLFEEAFHLNPSLAEAVNYLRMSREQLALQQLKRGEQPALGRTRPASSQRPAEQPQQAQQTTPAAPATLITSFKSPVNDGYVLIQINGEKIVHENLWEERKGIFRRRVARQVTVTRPVQSGNADIEVWVVVPSLKIQERRTIQHQFAPGSQSTLTVTLEPQSKKIDLRVS